MDYSLDKKLQSFKLIAQEKLQAILCSIPNPKDLIIEPGLIRPLEHVCVASWVKSKGVQKIFKFDQKVAVPKQSNTQIFLISANLITFKFVLDQIHEHENIKSQTTSSSSLNQTSIASSSIPGIASYHIIIVPNVYSCFHTLLEEEGLCGIVTLHRFNWDFIYIDEGVLSLEMPQVFNEIFLNKDFSLQSSIVHSFRVLNMIFGKPDLVICYGEISEKIFEMTERLENSQDNTSKSKQQSLPDFSSMIIVDRNKDYPSILLTPAIYSGLLLEVFNYRAGELEIQTKSNKIANNKLDIFKTPQKTSKPVKNNSNLSSSPTVLRMNSAYDEIFGENRYKHFSEASNLVRAQAKSLGLEIQNLNKMKINEMHEYVAKKLPKITDMKNKITKHLNVCEEVINELAQNFQKQLSLEEDILNNTNRKQILQKIDEMLILNGHKYNTIRIICLAHLSIGLSSDELSIFIKNYCNIFGYKYLYVFQLLSKANLLPEIENTTKSKLMLSQLPIPKFQQTEFQANANRLKLLINSLDKPPTNNKTIDDLSSSNGICPSYVFNGLYIPLIAQLSSILLKSENIDEFNSKLDIKNIKQLQQAVKKGELSDKFPIKRRTLIIFVVGGVTYAEISACNLIAKITNSRIVVTSNYICSGCDLISSAF